MQTTLPYLRFQLQQETQAIFQQKVQQKKVVSNTATKSPGDSGNAPASTVASSVFPSVLSPAPAAAAAAAPVTPHAPAVAASATASYVAGAHGVNPALKALFNQPKMLEALRNPHFQRILQQQQQAAAASLATKQRTAAPTVTPSAIPTPAAPVVTLSRPTVAVTAPASSASSSSTTSATAPPKATSASECK